MSAIESINPWYIIGAVVLVFILLRSMGSIRSSGTQLPAAGAETQADVERLLLSGNKISAIKVYRKIHGVGLKEAKDAVELIEAEKRKEGILK